LKAKILGSKHNSTTSEPEDMELQRLQDDLAAFVKLSDAIAKAKANVEAFTDFLAPPDAPQDKDGK